jgi:zinc finger CCHC domain-containing protein 8
MSRITFFTRPDCALCRSALYVIERVRRRHPFDLETVDISARGNERWLEAYKDHIPVIHLDGEEIFRHGVDERRLRELVSGSRRGHAGGPPDRRM